jgi:hypothetical protein
MDKWIVVLICWPLAYLVLRYRRAIKDFIGEIGFAEKIFGSGGTNTFIVIFGILVFVLSVMYAMGTLQAIIQNILGPLFGK